MKNMQAGTSSNSKKAKKSSQPARRDSQPIMKKEDYLARYKVLVGALKEIAEASNDSGDKKRQRLSEQNLYRDAILLSQDMTPVLMSHRNSLDFGWYKALNLCAMTVRDFITDLGNSWVENTFHELRNRIAAVAAEENAEYKIPDEILAITAPTQADVYGSKRSSSEDGSTQSTSTPRTPESSGAQSSDEDEEEGDLQILVSSSEVPAPAPSDPPAPSSAPEPNASPLSSDLQSRRKTIDGFCDALTRRLERIKGSQESPQQKFTALRALFKELAEKEKHFKTKRVDARDEWYQTTAAKFTSLKGAVITYLNEIAGVTDLIKQFKALKGIEDLAAKSSAIETLQKAILKQENVVIDWYENKDDYPEGILGKRFKEIKALLLTYSDQLAEASKKEVKRSTALAVSALGVSQEGQEQAQAEESLSDVSANQSAIQAQIAVGTAGLTAHLVPNGEDLAEAGVELLEPIDVSDEALEQELQRLEAQTGNEAEFQAFAAEQGVVDDEIERTERFVADVMGNIDDVLGQVAMAADSPSIAPQPSPSSPPPRPLTSAPSLSPVYQEYFDRNLEALNKKYDELQPKVKLAKESTTTSQDQKGELLDQIRKAREELEKLTRQSDGSNFKSFFLELSGKFFELEGDIGNQAISVDSKPKESKRQRREAKGLTQLQSPVTAEKESAFPIDLIHKTDIETLATDFQTFSNSFDQAKKEDMRKKLTSDFMPRAKALEEKGVQGFNEIYTLFNQLKNKLKGDKQNAKAKLIEISNKFIEFLKGIAKEPTSETSAPSFTSAERKAPILESNSEPTDDTPAAAGAPPRSPAPLPSSDEAWRPAVFRSPVLIPSTTAPDRDQFNLAATGNEEQLKVLQKQYEALDKQVKKFIDNKKDKSKENKQALKIQKEQLKKMLVAHVKQASELPKSPAASQLQRGFVDLIRRLDPKLRLVRVPSRSRLEQPSLEFVCRLTEPNGIIRSARSPQVDEAESTSNAAFYYPYNTELTTEINEIKLNYIENVARLSRSNDFRELRSFAKKISDAFKNKYKFFDNLDKVYDSQLYKQSEKECQFNSAKTNPWDEHIYQLYFLDALARYLLLKAERLDPSSTETREKLSSDIKVLQNSVVYWKEKLENKDVNLPDYIKGIFDTLWQHVQEKPSSNIDASNKAQTGSHEEKNTLSAPTVDSPRLDAESKRSGWRPARVPAGTAPAPMIVPPGDHTEPEAGAGWHTSPTILPAGGHRVEEPRPSQALSAHPESQSAAPRILLDDAPGSFDFNTSAHRAVPIKRDSSISSASFSASPSSTRTIQRQPPVNFSWNRSEVGSGGSSSGLFDSKSNSAGEFTFTPLVPPVSAPAAPAPAPAPANPDPVPAPANPDPAPAAANPDPAPAPANPDPAPAPANPDPVPAPANPGLAPAPAPNTAPAPAPLDAPATGNHFFNLFTTVSPYDENGNAKNPLPPEFNHLQTGDLNARITVTEDTINNFFPAGQERKELNLRCSGDNVIIEKLSNTEMSYTIPSLTPQQQQSIPIPAGESRENYLQTHHETLRKLDAVALIFIALATAAPGENVRIRGKKYRALAAHAASVFNEKLPAGEKRVLKFKPSTDQEKTQAKQDFGDVMNVGISITVGSQTHVLNAASLVPILPGAPIADPLMSKFFGPKAPAVPPPIVHAPAVPAHPAAPEPPAVVSPAQVPHAPPPAAGGAAPHGGVPGGPAAHMGPPPIPAHGVNPAAGPGFFAGPVVPPAPHGAPQVVPAGGAAGPGMPAPGY